MRQRKIENPLKTIFEKVSKKNIKFYFSLKFWVKKIRNVVTYEEIIFSFEKQTHHTHTYL